MQISRREWLAGSVAVTALGLQATPASAQAASAQPITMTNAASLAGVDLSGPWHWSIDPYRDGMAGFHGDPAGFGHRRYDDHDVDAVTRAQPNALIEYDMQRSPTAPLPSSWLIHDPTLRHYVGLMWYQRTFRVESTIGQRAFVQVGAANYRASVFVNGTLVGTHEGGFTPFNFEITPLLRAGENQITIGVDSEPSWDTVPPPVTDWENYGGCTRAVRVMGTPATFF